MGLEEIIMQKLQRGPLPYSKLKKLGKRSGEVSEVLYELRNSGRVYYFVGPDGIGYYALPGTLRGFFLKLKRKYREWIERRLQYPEQTGLEKLVIDGIDPILAYNTLYNRGKKGGFEMTKAPSLTVFYETKKGDRRSCVVYVAEEFEGTRENKKLGDVRLKVRYGFDESILSKGLIIEAEFKRMPGKVDRIPEKWSYIRKIASDIGPTLKARTYALGMVEKTVRKCVLTSNLLYSVLEEAWYNEPKGWLSKFVIEVISDDDIGIGKSKRKLAEFIVALLYRLGEIKMEKGKLNLESLCLTRR